MLLSKVVSRGCGVGASHHGVEEGEWVRIARHQRVGRAKEGVSVACGAVAVAVPEEAAAKHLIKHGKGVLGKGSTPGCSTSKWQMLVLLLAIARLVAINLILASIRRGCVERVSWLVVGTDAIDRTSFGSRRRLTGRRPDRHIWVQ